MTIITVRCKTCGATLMTEFEYGELQITPCENCITVATEAGREVGYEEGRMDEEESSYSDYDYYDDGYAQGYADAKNEENE